MYTRNEFQDRHGKNSSKKKTPFTIKLDFKEETSKVLPLDYSFVWC